MADQDSSISQPPSSPTVVGHTTDLLILAALKFLISNIKHIVPNLLSAENYSIWRIQLLHHFTANGFSGFLSGYISRPADSASVEYQKWCLIDRNLTSALFSTISLAILPYVSSATSSHDFWTILERRMQLTNRSRVIQLKNELHNIQMKNSSMQQYLLQIKNLVDHIAASGSPLDTEDIVLYILNGLPSSYSSFKTVIRTSLQPIDLDTLYSLLILIRPTVEEEYVMEVDQ